MQQLAQGDMGALGVLYTRYARMVLSVMIRQTQLSSTEADDLCQEVFLAVHSAAKRYQNTGKFKGWLCGIALRKAKEAQRSRWVKEKILSRLLGRAETPIFDSNLAVEARHDLESILASLSADHREVMQLHLIEGLGAADIGAALGISEKTVWTRLHRARAHLREADGDANVD